jgi:hypothetical protein
MSSVYFAAVDENANFPQEIREQLAKSPELKYTLIPMSQSTRDNFQDRWHGLTIYNLNKKSIEFWDIYKNAWIKLFDENTQPPTYPNPWDINYNLPSEVRNTLAASAELKYMVLPVSTSVRNALLPEERWDGRVIYNTTIKKLETWNSSLAQWVYYLDETYEPPSDDLTPMRTTWYPWVFYISELANIPHPPTTEYDNYLGVPYWVSGGGTYEIQNNQVKASFSLGLSGPPRIRTGLPPLLNEKLIMPLPVIKKTSGSLLNIGNVQIISHGDISPTQLNYPLHYQGFCLTEGSDQFITFHFSPTMTGGLDPVTATDPFIEYIDINDPEYLGLYGHTIRGFITYEKED